MTFLRHVQLAAPADWEDLSVITYAAPSTTGFRTNLVVTAEPLPPREGDMQALQSFADAQILAFASSLAGHSHTAPQPCRVGESGVTEGVEFRQTFLTTEGERIQQRLLFFAVRGSDATQVVTATLTASANEDVDALWASTCASVIPMSP
jgi:hypothetical protein